MRTSLFLCMFMGMKIGLIGYGQMGREVESVALARNHVIEFVIDENNLQDLTPDVLSKAEVVVEFTRPDSAFNNIKACMAAGVPVVSGTTGWIQRLEEIKALCTELGGGLFYASNFSIGVNLYFELNAALAKLMSPYPDYSVRLEEIHHTRKKDAPSGTALTLAGQIITDNENIAGWTPDLIAPKDQIQVTSIREGNVTGTHSVVYVSDEDRISITHEAFTRRSFARGAVAAAEFMAGRTGIFTMKDLIKQ